MPEEKNQLSFPHRSIRLFVSHLAYTPCSWSLGVGPMVQVSQNLQNNEATRFFRLGGQTSGHKSIPDQDCVC